MTPKDKEDMAEAVTSGVDHAFPGCLVFPLLIIIAMLGFIARGVYDAGEHLKAIREHITRHADPASSP